jgi:ribonuclease HII
LRFRDPARAVSRSPATIAAIRAELARATGDDLAELLRVLADDPRAGAQALLREAHARARRVEAETARLDLLMLMQRDLHARGVRVVAGIDEVGRGALAGPVTAAAVILAADVRIDGLNDSKKLSREARERVATAVREQAVAWSVAHAGPEEIDALGVGPATRLAWRRALDGLGTPVDHVLVDGNDGRGLGPAVTAVIRGDAQVAAIAAASVLAKVTRDALMAQLAPDYPGYGFEGNRGYGSPDHLERLRSVGPSPVHRHSFSPCTEWQRLF